MFHKNYLILFIMLGIFSSNQLFSHVHKSYLSPIFDERSQEVIIYCDISKDEMKSFNDFYKLDKIFRYIDRKIVKVQIYLEDNKKHRYRWLKRKIKSRYGLQREQINFLLIDYN